MPTVPNTEPRQPVANGQRVHALGFWLPCGRTNFYDAATDRIVGNSGRLVVTQPRGRSGCATLSDPVCRRLSDVLTARKYHEITRIFPKAATDSGRRELYPEAICFVRKRLKDPADASGNIKATEVGDIIFFATVSGFFYLLALCPESANYDATMASLKEEVADLFGGNFYSHFSGRKEDAFRASADDIKSSLKEYETAHQGILNFFQINSIVEGIFNSNLDPSIFFRERDDAAHGHSVEAAQRARDRYRSAIQHFTLGRFSSLISVPIDFHHGTQQAAELTRMFRAVVDAPAYNAACSLLDHVHEACRAPVLMGFMDGTSADCLRPLKLMIEKSRRALLGRMLEVTHRRYSIVQAESPTDTADQLVFENEDQLRGYIMLVSAKLPTINNISNHLHEQVSAGGQAATVPHTKASEPTDPLFQSLNSWTRLLASVADNLCEIEKAIGQSRLDRLLFEQSQMRAQQETAAELDRVRNRFGLSSGGTASLWDFPGAMYTAVALAFSAFAVIYPLLPNKDGKPGNGYFGTNDLGLLLLFLVPLSVSGLLILRRIKTIKENCDYRIDPKGKEHHFEFDFHLDVPIGKEEANFLSAAALRQARVWRREQQAAAPDGQAWERYADSPMRIEEDSYLQSFRVDGLTLEGAAIKVVAEVEIWWTPATPKDTDSLFALVLRLLRMNTEKLRVSIIYEILSHHPSGGHKFVLRDVRAIALYGSQLSPAEIRNLRRRIIHSCINVLIPEAEDTIFDLVDLGQATD